LTTKAPEGDVLHGITEAQKKLMDRLDGCSDYEKFCILSNEAAKIETPPE